MRRHGLVTASLLSVVAVILTACSSSGSGGSSSGTTAASGGSSASTASAGGSGNGAGRTITVGVLNSFSGAYSASFPGTVQGVDARLKAYAASGGKCSGVKINVVQGDDQSTPQGAVTASEQLVQQNKVFAILNGSAMLFGAAQYLTTAAKGTPVLGGGFDGAPQWRQTGTNLFPVPAVDNLHNVYDTVGRYLKALGATKFSVVGFDSPSSSADLNGSIIGAQANGLQIGYVNEKLPIGTTDIGAEVLGIKNSGADAVELSVTPPTAFAIAAGLKQAGVKMKAIIADTGYGADLLGSSSAVQAGQGVTFQIQYAPTELNTPATKLEQAALKQYAGSASGIPSYSQENGWFAADLLIYGLEKAGCDASQSDFMNALKNDTTYNAGGLLAKPVDFTKPGVGNGNECIYFVTLQGSAFVPDPKGSPMCGQQTGKNVSGY